MATPSHGERPGLLHNLYKRGSTSVNTPATMATYIVQQIYDTEVTRGEHRQELIDAIATGLALMKGTI